MNSILFKDVTTSADFGARVSEERQLLGMSVESLASAASVSTTTIRAIESGTRNPRLGTVKAIAQALGKRRHELGMSTD